MPISIDSLQAQNDPYSVTASVDGGLKTTEVTGDRNTAAFSEAAGDDMGKNDFLTLLTTQMKYQDPMEPMDNTQMVSQLAQFSQLETMAGVGTSMDGLEKSFQDSLGIQNNSAMSVTNSSAVSLIGKEVRLRQQSFDWLGSGDAEFNVHMGQRKSVNVEIFDDDGEVVQAFTIDKKDLTNAGTFKWDGKNLQGLPADAGEYGIYIEGQEKNPALYCFVEDTVQGVRYDATGPVVKVAGEELPIGNILEVNTVVASEKADSLDLTMSQALGLVGKEIKYADYGTSYAPKYGGEREFSIDFAGSAQATIIIRDGEGNVADKFTVTNDGSGGVKSFDVPLDDINGTGGVYSVSIENNPNAFFFKQSPISGVVPSGSGIKLKVDGMQISAKDIMEVSA